MGLDIGNSNKEEVKIFDDRSKEYIDKVNKDISVAKAELASIVSEINKAKEDLKLADQSYADKLVEIGNNIETLNKNKRAVQDSVDALLKQEEDLQNIIVKENKALDDKKASVALDIINEKEKAEKVLAEISSKASSIKESISDMNKTIDKLYEEKKLISDEVSAILAKKQFLEDAVSSLVKDRESKEGDIKALETNKADLQSFLENINVDIMKAQSKYSDLSNSMSAIDARIKTVDDAEKENTRRARELQDMSEDLRIKEIALANKNAYLAKKEATLKDAQTKV